MAEILSGVYQIRNLNTGKIYIGSSKDLVTRRTQHFSRLRCDRHSNSHLQRAFKKYGENSFEWSVIEFCEEERLIERETFWISKIGRSSELYNIKPAKEGKPGFTHSDETKGKISKANKGKKKNYSECGLERHLVAIRKPKSIEARRKMAKAKNKYWPKVVSPEGKVFEIDVLSWFCIEHGLDVSAMRKVLVGMRPTHKGWSIQSKQIGVI